MCIRGWVGLGTLSRRMSHATRKYSHRNGEKQASSVWGEEGYQRVRGGY